MHKTNPKYLTFLAAVVFLFFLVPLYSQDKSREASEKKKRDPVKKRKKKERKLQGKELDNLLDRLEKNLGQLRSLKTRFIQNKYLSIFKKPVRSRGVFLFLSPDRVRFEITKPFHSVMIASSASVAKYEWVEGKWKKLKLGNSDLILIVTGQIATWTKGLFRKKKDLYLIEGREGENKKIILTPRDKKFRQHIGAIEVGIAKDEKSLDFVIIRETGGDYTEMLFLDKKQNLNLSKDFFDTDRETPAPLK